MHWIVNAKCRTADPDLYFPDPDLPLPSAEAIAALCDGCPVQSECRKYARNIGSAWGVWGSELWEDGKVVVGRST